jgi:hypothetical protein
MKLKWGRQQDLEDAEAICVRRRKSLDLGRLRAFARREGMLPEVEALLKRSSVDDADGAEFQSHSTPRRTQIVIPP